MAKVRWKNIEYSHHRKSVGWVDLRYRSRQLGQIMINKICLRKNGRERQPRGRRRWSRLLSQRLTKLLSPPCMVIHLARKLESIYLNLRASRLSKNAATSRLWSKAGTRSFKHVTIKWGRFQWFRRGRETTIEALLTANRPPSVPGNRRLPNALAQVRWKSLVPEIYFSKKKGYRAICDVGNTEWYRKLLTDRHLHGIQGLTFERIKYF